MNKYDVIVIGAGCGGLTAAASAAKKGKKVLLLEKHNVPGGFATSFVRGRFEFEASLHELCGFGFEEGQGSVRKILDGLGVSAAVKWVAVPDAYRVITKSRAGAPIDAVMPFGIQKYIDKMETYVPGSRPSMERLFALAEDIVKSIDFFGALDGKPDFATARKILKEHMNFIRTAPYSVNDVLHALCVPPLAQDIFTAYWSYLGAPCDTVSFIHYIVMVYTYLTLGAVVPKFRSHDLSMALADAVEKSGGEIWYNAPVSRILLKEGKACGVRLADRTEIFAENIVCNISPSTVFSKMISHDDVPERDIKLTNARQFGARGMSLYLALNRPPELLGINDYSVFLYDTADSRRQYAQMGSLSANDAQATVCLNIADPSCSPKGTTLMCFTALFTGDCFGGVQPEDYFDLKRKLADRLIDNYEKKTGAQLRGHIEEIELATPMTYARYTDTPQGTIYGYLAEDWDGIVPRIMTAKNDASPLGLRFCGGWGKRLSGYSAALGSGCAVVEELLKDEEEAKRKEAAALEQK